jgi:hypothetical protein
MCGAAALLPTGGQGGEQGRAEVCGAQTKLVDVTEAAAAAERGATCAQSIVTLAAAAAAAVAAARAAAVVAVCGA